MATNIITLRNAGSDINNMVDILSVIHSVFGSDPFNLKSLTDVATDENLMSSNGRIGKEARIRSFNKNVSLDSIPMQFKAYAEIYRLLGWMRSETDKKRTTYRITYIGKHIVQTPTPYKLIEQSFLGIDLPNNVVVRDCFYEIRLLWCYLRAINHLDNKATKHELLYVCHFITDDESDSEFNSRISHIISSRQNNNHYKQLKIDLTELCKDAKPKSILLDTLDNSTRITLSALSYTHFNWTVKHKNTYSLTSYGKSLVDSYAGYFRPRLSDVINYDSDSLKALSIVGLIQVLSRSGYTTSGLEQVFNYDEQYQALLNEDKIKYHDQKVWFLPHQTLSPNEIIEVFGSTIESNHNNNLIAPKNSKSSNLISPASVTKTKTSYLKLTKDMASNYNDVQNNSFIDKINYFFKKENDIERTISSVHEFYRKSNQNVYYKIIGEAFEALGFECKIERHGQNSLRWDAIILDGERSIPIEIKSPGEEEFISVKAIRQALENRVIRCARYSSIDNISISSYVVGYNYPSERAEVNELIDYIEKSFGVRIALFSLNTLTRLILKRSQNHETPEKESFFSLIGNVEISETN